MNHTSIHRFVHVAITRFAKLKQQSKAAQTNKKKKSHASEGEGQSTNRAGKKRTHIWRLVGADMLNYAFDRRTARCNSCNTLQLLVIDHVVHDQTGKRERPTKEQLNTQDQQREVE